MMEAACRVDWPAVQGSQPRLPGESHGIKKMVAHWKFGQSSPVCGALVQRVVSAERRFNYCPGCQTGGWILKDRSLSGLPPDAWPDNLDDLPAS